MIHKASRARLALFQLYVPHDGDGQAGGGNQEDDNEDGDQQIGFRLADETNAESARAAQELRRSHGEKGGDEGAEK